VPLPLLPLISQEQREGRQACLKQGQRLARVNKKIVPLNIKQLLTPRGLAYWIMDDGSLQNKGLHLNVYGFSYNEVVLLKSTLETLFNPNAFIKCSIHNHKKGYRLYIWEESMIIVRNHIFQYMHKDMLYKINPK
jgi:LAGLIDADG DNA endonuclease family